jgi:hypothetical protein
MARTEYASSESVSEDEDLEWEWENRRLKFLAKLAGIADSCLEVVRKDGEAEMNFIFKDAKDKFTVGMAAVELIGKINSGKFDPPSEGDRIPQLSPRQLNQMFNFYFVKGSPEPDR